MDVQARATYRLVTFGGLSVAGGTAPLAGAATQRKTLLLLAALAAAGEQGISREKLVALFWPDSDAERARHALKQAVHILRRDFRDPDLIAGTTVLRLDPEHIESDVREFEEALARGDDERAAELHRGPFLDGLYLDGAPEFERWLERERSRLGNAHAAALGRLAAAAAAAGDHARAAGWWRRLAAVDPLSSRVAVELMKALAAAGDPEGALTHARVHAALVEQELDTPPDPAVAALAERVRADLRARQAAPVPRPSAGPAEAADAPAASRGDAANAPAGPAALAAPARPAAPITRGLSRRMGVGIAIAAVLVVVLLSGIRRIGGPAAAARTAVPLDRSVAVLPFVDMSAGGESTYFGDGLSEELITALSRIDGLRVAARTSSFALRDARLDARTIGDTLGVATVVEGSVRRDGGRLRVTAQLIDARSGFHLWSREYDREMKDVFAVQDEIAGAIAGALRLTLEGNGAGAAARPVSSEAHDLYLRGTWFRNRLTKDAIDKAIAYYDRAIALDSGYALAYAGKASAMGPLFYYRQAPLEPGLSEMRAAARRALELDDGLGEAHVAIGIIHFFYEWDWPAAEREFRRATELNPGDAHAFHMLANWLRAMGRFDEAIAARRRSLELDPLNARTAISLGRDYVGAGRYEEAAEAYRRGIDLDPVNPLVLGLGPNLPAGLGDVYEHQGRYREAVEEYVTAAVRRGAAASDTSALRAAYAKGGMPGFWRRWLEFEERTAGGQPRALRLARIHARIGDEARVLDWLERAYAERDPGLVFLAVDQEWAPLRQAPRMRRLLEGMRLAR